jgi:hypothetical protein
MARVGAIAGFLVEFSRHSEIYFLPIQVLARWRTESRRKSLPRSFFSGHLIAARGGKGLLIFDYLSAIAEQEARYGTSFDNRARSDWTCCASSERWSRVSLQVLLAGILLLGVSKQPGNQAIVCDERLSALRRQPISGLRS